MADTKISALTAATTPLAGTEVLPIVQSNVTVKVANNDLRPKQIQSNATSGVLQIAGPTAGTTRVMTTPDANFTAARTDAANSFTGDQTLSTGNLIQGTASKGVNFTANSTGSGTMTSQLLNWYEEGNWTPTVTAGTGTITTVGTVSGTYTRIGRFVSYYFSVVITTNGTGSNYVLVSGLPFATSGFAGSGTEVAATGKMIQCFANNSTSVRLKFYDYTYPGSDGATFNCVVNGYI